MSKSKLTKTKYAHLRIQYTATIIKEACEGRGIPEGVRKEDWIAYNQASMMEDLASMIAEMGKS